MSWMLIASYKLIVVLKLVIFFSFSNCSSFPNLGYAFVNFTTSAGAERFRHAYNGRPWEAEYQTKKVASIKNSHIQVVYHKRFNQTTVLVLSCTKNAVAS
jgi:hypothetical protein